MQVLLPAAWLTPALLQKMFTLVWNFSSAPYIDCGYQAKQLRHMFDVYDVFAQPCLVEPDELVLAPDVALDEGHLAGPELLSELPSRGRAQCSVTV